MGFQVFCYITSLVWMGVHFLPQNSSCFPSVLEHCLLRFWDMGKSLWWPWYLYLNRTDAYHAWFSESSCLWSGLMMSIARRGPSLSGAWYLCIWLPLISKCFCFPHLSPSCNPRGKTRGRTVWNVTLAIMTNRLIRPLCVWLVEAGMGLGNFWSHGFVMSISYM